MASVRMSVPGRIISISGADGCGKTTIIDLMRSMLSELGVPSCYVWLRYNHYMSKSVLGFCRLAGLTRYEEIGGVRVGYHEFYKSKVVSWTFVVLTYFDTLIASVMKVYIPTFFGKNVIICDRWILDILVDLELDTRIQFNPSTGIGRMFMGLIPARCHSFVIFRDQKALIDSRKENALDRNFSKRLSLYERQGSYPGVTPIRNDQSAEAAARRILSRAGFDPGSCK